MFFEIQWTPCYISCPRDLPLKSLACKESWEKPSEVLRGPSPLAGLQQQLFPCSCDDFLLRIDRCCHFFSVLCILIEWAQDLKSVFWYTNGWKSSYAKKEHAMCHSIYFTYSNTCQMWPEIVRAVLFPVLLCKSDLRFYSFGDCHWILHVFLSELNPL